MRSLLLGADDDRPALIDADSGRVVSYRELAGLVSERIDELAELSGHLVFLGATNQIETVVDYLALVAQGSTCALLDPATPAETLSVWLEAYRPEAVWGLANTDDRWSDALAETRGAATEAVLLATSGSTGSPKFVRLTARNVAANAQQIATALGLDATERALAHLPLFYSFGLSILNSHLVVGASVVLCGHSAVRPEFWDALAAHEVTSLSGVPYNFEMFRRMKLVEKDLPSLRHVTQAGGKLQVDRIAEFHAGLTARGIQFWVMYGQTEATARISVLPAGDLPDHIGSVGFPLPDGTITIDDPDHNGEGELIYSGPNVMLGYAHERNDLGSIDEMEGRLPTGDLGRLDPDGRIWITGRMKRIAKVFGTRMNLDDLERQLASLGAVAVIDADDQIRAFLESPEPIDGLARKIERTLGLPPRSVLAETIEALPLTGAGKVDYQELRRR